MLYIHIVTVCEDFQVASFKRLDDAKAFAYEIDEEYQCEVCSIVSIACVDNYGYPVTRKEYADAYK